MQIQSPIQAVQYTDPVTAATKPAAAAAGGASTDPTSDPSSDQSANPSIDGLANENTFLQLLVAQIKNQDPLNPTDSVQFLSQLAQFSQLEQLIGIRQELKPATSTDTTNGTTS